jgi:hypothetical protein
MSIVETEWNSASSYYFFLKILSHFWMALATWCWESLKNISRGSLLPRWKISLGFPLFLANFNYFLQISKWCQIPAWKLKLLTEICMGLLDNSWHLHKCSGKHIETFQLGSGYTHERVYMRSPLAICMYIYERFATPLRELFCNY